MTDVNHDGYPTRHDYIQSASNNAIASFIQRLKNKNKNKNKMTIWRKH
jgi:hypothetical protein